MYAYREHLQLHVLSACDIESHIDASRLQILELSSQANNPELSAAATAELRCLEIASKVRPYLTAANDVARRRQVAAAAAGGNDPGGNDVNFPAEVGLSEQGLEVLCDPEQAKGQSVDQLQVRQLLQVGYAVDLWMMFEAKHQSKQVKKLHQNELENASTEADNLEQKVRWSPCEEELSASQVVDHKWTVEGVKSLQTLYDQLTSNEQASTETDQQLSRKRYLETQDWLELLRMQLWVVVLKRYEEALSSKHNTLSEKETVWLLHAELKVLQLQFKRELIQNKEMLKASIDAVHSGHQDNSEMIPKLKFRINQAKLALLQHQPEHSCHMLELQPIEHEDLTSAESKSEQRGCFRVHLPAYTSQQPKNRIHEREMLEESVSLTCMLETFC